VVLVVGCKLGRKAEGCARTPARQLQATHMLIGEPSCVEVAPNILCTVSLSFWRGNVGTRMNEAFEGT